MKRTALLLLVGTMLLVGCDPEVEDSHGDGIEMNLGPNEAFMTQEDLGDDWPLTVEDGIVTCEGAGEVYFQSGGVVYPVKGTAQGASDGPDIEAIWKDDPYFEGTKINIHPIIERGLELCE